MRNCVTGNLTRLEIYPSIFCPLTISNIPGNIVNYGVTVKFSNLFSRGSLAIRRRHVDRPGDRLVQVVFVSTFNIPTGWHLGAWINWAVVVNGGLIVVNRDRRVRCRDTRKVDLFRNLTIDNLPTRGNHGVSVNGLVRLTVNCVGFDLVAILVNVDDTGYLVVGRVGDINRHVFLAIPNRDCWHIGLGDRVAGNLVWLEVRPSSADQSP